MHFIIRFTNASRKNAFSTRRFFASSQMHFRRRAKRHKLTTRAEFAHNHGNSTHTNRPPAIILPSSIDKCKLPSGSSPPSRPSYQQASLLPQAVLRWRRHPWFFSKPTSNSKNYGRCFNTIMMICKPLPLLPRHPQLIIIFLATIANMSVTRSHQLFLRRTIPRLPQLPQISGNLRQINNALPHLVQLFSSFDADIAALRINSPSHLFLSYAGPIQFILQPQKNHVF